MPKPSPGYGDLSCYGQKTLATPNLDRLAAEGMRFTRHYAGMTVCSPSRCVLMTGKNSGRSAVRTNWDPPMPDATVTLASVLKTPHANNEGGKADFKRGMEVPDFGPFADRDWPDEEKGFARMIRDIDATVASDGVQ